MSHIENFITKAISSCISVDGANSLLRDLSAKESGFKDYHEQCQHVKGSVTPLRVNDNDVVITFNAKTKNVVVIFRNVVDDESATSSNVTFYVHATSDGQLVVDC